MTDNPMYAEEQEFPQVPKRKSRTVWKLVLLALLLLLLALVVYSTYYYIKNRHLPIPRVTSSTEKQIPPPEYLYSISGPPGVDALTRPVGVAVSSADVVYATDTKAGVVRAYSTEGRYKFTIKDQLKAPAHLAIGPDGNLYVSDRRVRAVLVYTPDGTFVRKIAPTGADATMWSPLAMTFDASRNLYVTDVGISDKHRVIVFKPDGTELRRFGSTGRANQMSDLPGKFYFPNGIVLDKAGRLFIGDSDNRRVQVYAADGSFDYFIRTAGIPRGMVIDKQDRLYVVDALAHMVDIYSLKGERLVSFGGPGIGPGEFRYANDIALDRNGRIYVSDRENHQIQVWAWPAEEIVVPGAPKTTSQWALCLSPLLLLPILFLAFRRKRFAVTPDFVDEMESLERVADMRRRRWLWVTPKSLWPSFRGRVVEGVDLGELIEAQEHSDADARDLVDRLGISYDEAVLLVVAKRAKRLCTENARTAALAAALDIEAMDASTFIARYAKGDRGRSVKKG